jgi:hypothetical protein
VDVIQVPEHAEAVVQRLLANGASEREHLRRV